MRLLAVASLSAAALAFPQSPLGPRDGRELPPADLDRIQVGAPAPGFTLETAGGARVSLADYRGRKRVVLVFYRGHW